MQVKSTVKLNMPRIRQLSQAAVVALEQTAELLHGEVKDAQVVPMDTGNLTGEAFFCDYSESKNGKVTLVHETPYARRLYYHPEYDFQTKYHANAKGKWFEDWMPGGSKADFAPNAFKKFYKKAGGV